MKQVLIQLDDETAAQLEQIAPGRSRKRSEFLRKVISRALQEALEERTRAAYAKWPDEPPSFDPGEWAAAHEAMRPPSGRTVRRSTRGKARK